MTTSLPPAIHSALPAQTASLTVPFWPAPLDPAHSYPTLHYAAGDGPWFERLCYRLILHEGHIAQYFGRNGQAQFGIDFVSTKGEQYWCWQSKNTAITPALLETWVQKFTDEALDREKLPAPHCFVILCTGTIKDVQDSKQYLPLRASLKQRGIEFELRGREWFDAQLKGMPDIVAEMFGEPAVQVHCANLGWRGDVFWPIGEGRMPLRLRSYEIARKNGSIWRDEGDSLARLSAQIEAQELSVVCGMSGAGKTFLALNACVRPGWRCYYLHLPSESASAHEIAHAMQLRLSSPVFFVLDDVHQDWDKTANLIDKFRLLGAGRQWRIICTARRVGAGEEDVERSDGHAFLEQLEADGGLYSLALDDKALCRYIKSQRPDWLAVRQDDLLRLANACGRNLFLIGKACAALHTPAKLTAQAIKREILRHARQAYFKNAADNHEAWFRFAALAASDIDPRCDFFSLQEQRAIAQLGQGEPVWLASQGHPPCFCAEHPAAAEVLLHALVREDRVAGSLLEQSGAVLAEYCAWLLAHEGESALAQALLLVLRTRPALLEPADDYQLKAAILADERVLEVWLRFAMQHDVRLISWSCMICTRAGHALAPVLAQRYIAALQDKIAALIHGGGDVRWLHGIGYGLRTLNQLSRDYVASLLSAFPISAWYGVIKRGALQDCMQLLENTPPGFSAQVIALLDDDLLETIFRTTVQSGRSLGALHLALRDLGLHDARDNSALLSILEKKIGVQRWLSLLQGATLPDLFHLLENSTPDFAAQLISGLDDALLEAIFRTTVQSGRSLGALNFALRELGLHDARNQSALLSNLEKKIGAQRWLSLLQGATLPDLFPLFQRSTPDFARKLIQGLDDALLDAVLANTVQSERSLLSVAQAMALLARRGAMRSQFEQAFNASRMDNLLQQCGSLAEVNDLLASFSNDFRQACVELLWQWPASAWRACALRDGAEKQFYQLCRFIGAYGFTMQTCAPAALDALVQIAVELVPAQAWYPVRTGLDCLPSPADFAPAAHIQEALAHRLSLISCSAFDAADWNDLAHAPQLFWQSRPDLRQPWANGVLARFATQPDDADLFAMTAHRLLGGMHLVEFSDADAGAVLQNALQAERIEILLQAKNIAAPFHYLWSCAAASYERRADLKSGTARHWENFMHAFGKSIPAESDKLLHDWLQAQTAEPTHFQSYASLLALAGLLQLLGRKLPPTPCLKWENNGKKYSIYMRLKNPDCGFILSCFLQLGARATLNDFAAFRPDRCELLAGKYATFCQTPHVFPRHRALDAVAQWVEYEGGRIKKLAAIRRH
ncbi:hypothetical protein V8J88_13475 [Massilia sp. W12]|uniref:hypothetical protein n=1 Tax=Massilia sp. W12 TaxID=3126507 RepID=UPI0030CAE852